MKSIRLKKNTDIPVLHSLRAVAALSVALFHFICTVNGYVDSTLIKFFFSYGHFGVQMFFVISGFIIPWSMYHGGYKLKNFFTFSAKRLIRLEPPYLLSLVFAIALTYLRQLSPHYNGVDITPSLKQILLHFGYLIPFFEGERWIRAIYWTLAIEFQYYLAIGLLFPFFTRNSVFRFITYILILAGPFMLKGFLPFHFPVFLLGIILFLYKLQKINSVELTIVAIISTIEVFFFHGHGAVIFSGFAFLAILFFTDFRNAVMDFIGDISYSIYLFHGLTGMVILNFFAHTITDPWIKFLLLILAIAVTIVTSYLVFRFIELPSKRYSSKIKFKK
jgi:peptidoglycan/LPS O-acetylase OafA/YrhL